MYVSKSQKLHYKRPFIWLCKLDVKLNVKIYSGGQELIPTHSIYLYVRLKCVEPSNAADNQTKWGWGAGCSWEGNYSVSPPLYCVLIWIELGNTKPLHNLFEIMRYYYHLNPFYLCCLLRCELFMSSMEIRKLSGLCRKNGKREEKTKNTTPTNDIDDHTMWIRHM